MASGRASVAGTVCDNTTKHVGNIGKKTSERLRKVRG